MLASVEMLPRRPAFFRGPAAASGIPSRVRRALYRSSEDIPQSLEFVRRELASIANRSRERWNFDFDTGLPLGEGRYEWTPVTAPSSSAEPQVELGKPESSEPSKKDGPATGENLKQKKLPDYWCSRKRHSSSPSHKPSMVTGDNLGPAPAKIHRAASS